MQVNKHLLKALITLLVIDVGLLAAFIWWMDATPDVSIAELLIVPTIFIVNLIIGLVIYYSTNYRVIGKAFAYNSVVASLVFHSLFYTWFLYYDRTHFDTFYFNQNGKQFEVLLDKRDTSYSMFEIGDGSTLEFNSGKYEEYQDTIMLGDSTRRLYIYKTHLVGYPKIGDKVILKTEGR
ncbi:DUF4040 domain-containing protein [Mucilaginibacter sp. JRF]|uniref:DUF4040 domain-containing protein n=1 Tax=Mucilaginibacter sp. JRF TaxID=2780088 RepID=UPI00188275B7|nr:DUF4040 domain-containing protein [Mucilaginibacter sp. JRF]MBE9584025.1 DUF4040 domain-containing protein [Mucilaginibacter sp. JRF]